jgi:hypothetical protein
MRHPNFIGSILIIGQAQINLGEEIELQDISLNTQ